MVNFNCQICNAPFDSEKKLHFHLKSHRITLANYYQNYYPRKDKLTGEFIQFKNKERILRVTLTIKIILRNGRKLATPKKLVNTAKI